MAFFTVRRGSSTALENVVLADGQLLFTIDGGHIYMDNGTERIEFYKKDLDNIDTKINDAKKAGTDAQTSVNSLSAKVGEVADGKTVVGMINDLIANGYDDTEVRGLITANKNAIDTLNGTGEGSVAKKVADGIAALVADAPESLDTLKEIADWIDGHGKDAAAMNSQITTNKNDIAALKTALGATGTGEEDDPVVIPDVDTTVSNAINALDVTDVAVDGQYVSAVSETDGKISVSRKALPQLEWGTFESAAAGV